MLGELLLMCATAVGGQPPGCSNMPIRNSVLIQGVYQPRPHPKIIYHYVDNVERECIVQFAIRGEQPREGTTVRACSIVPRDDQLAEQPYCIIYLPKNPNPELVEHEKRHCEGWDHPPM